MKNLKFKLLASFLVIGSFANAGGPTPGLHTENNEVVCQMDDFLETKLYIDRDTTFDKHIGTVSPKVILQPTKNAYGWDYQLFESILVKVSRARCPDCQDVQTILFAPVTVDDVVHKLEVTKAMNGNLRATLTRNVDRNGKPLNPSYIDHGVCTLNEVE